MPSEKNKQCFESIGWHFPKAQWKCYFAELSFTIIHVVELFNFNTPRIFIFQIKDFNYNLLRLYFLIIPRCLCVLRHYSRYKAKNLGLSNFLFHTIFEAAGFWDTEVIATY
jgi:hypothetical protein